MHPRMGDLPGAPTNDVRRTLPGKGSAGGANGRNACRRRPKDVSYHTRVPGGYVTSTRQSP